MPDYYKALSDIAKRQNTALEKARATIHALHGDIAWDTYENAPEMKLIDAALKEWQQFNATGN